MIPKVDFCGLEVSRLIIGANPFGGFSHQNAGRDREMLEYYTVDRIIETWGLAEDSGINTMITNNESAHVVEAVKTYKRNGGRLQWIAQVNHRLLPDMHRAIDEVVGIGCDALYFHGALIDDAYANGDEDVVRNWAGWAREAGVPVGVAGHDPRAHLWAYEEDLVDFHAVCFFNCGSLHRGEGSKFRLADVGPAVDCIRTLAKPCIGYKIMGAGRIDPRMAFEYAFEKIKPGDVVNVGMFRGDRDDMVAANCSLAEEILGGVVSSLR